MKLPTDIFLKMAFVNIWRNARRSLITILAIEVGLGGLIFLWGYKDGAAAGMLENATSLFTGHVQVHALGFDKTMSPGLTITDPVRLIQDIQGHPEVIGIARRVKCGVMIGTSEHSKGAMLLGIDPQQEVNVTRVKSLITRGVFLSDGAKKEILLGDRLAEKLNVAVGDKVVVMVHSVDGLLTGFAYHVTGIFHAGTRILDEEVVYADIASAQELLGIGSDVSEIVVRLNDLRAMSSFLPFVNHAVDTAKYEVLTWDQAEPEAKSLADWGEGIVRVIVVAMTIVIAIGIMNTVIMSVLERTKEFGVMLAIGVKPRQLIRLVLLESFLLQCVGIGVGVFFGYSLVTYFGYVGIPLWYAADTFSAGYVSPVIYTRVYPEHVVLSVLILIVVTSVVSLYPAVRAGRLNPVAAIYRS
ncbi:MAG: ABC transporter permease [Candidatus Omnitrophica bacterium]|nr:ABC transporter permease [Candidatus Omnitrophota bacterium]